MQSLPDFEQAMAMVAGEVQAEELSEAHGILCGLLCGRPLEAAELLNRVLVAREVYPTGDEAFQDIIAELLDSTRLQLADSQMGFELWLPEDEQDLPRRAEALGTWCSGFLAGLAEASGEGLAGASEDVQEVIRDMGEIARVSASAGLGDDEADEEEGEELAFTEIVEFVRVAVLLVQEELRGPDGNDSVH